MKKPQTGFIVIISQPYTKFFPGFSDNILAETLLFEIMRTVVVRSNDANTDI